MQFKNIREIIEVGMVAHKHTSPEENPTTLPIAAHVVMIYS